MPTITARNVPEATRDTLSRAARRNGQSLQSYVLTILEREARFARNIEIAELGPVGGGLLTTAEVVEAVRAARTDELDSETGGAGHGQASA